jgi:hypothetical protein
MTEKTLQIGAYSVRYPNYQIRAPIADGYLGHSRPRPAHFRPKAPTRPERGFQTAAGNTLDWHYVAKVVRKLGREAVFAVDQQKIQDRLAITKERYRLMVERLWRIIDYKWEYLEKFGL